MLIQFKFDQVQPLQIAELRLTISISDASITKPIFQFEFDGTQGKFAIVFSEENTQRLLQSSTYSITRLDLINDDKNVVATAKGLPIALIHSDVLCERLSLLMITDSTIIPSNDAGTDSDAEGSMDTNLDGVNDIDDEGDTGWSDQGPVDVIFATETGCTHSSLTQCDMLCVNLLTDETHCGKCDRSCQSGEKCQSGLCIKICNSDCSGKQCGSNGCGGSCGNCAEGLICNSSGQCVCTPQCSGKQCGSDGCNATCGTCSGGAFCNGTVGLCTDEIKVFPPDTSFIKHMGNSAALFGATALLGADHDDHKGNQTGSAYVFTNTSTGWGFQQKIIAPDAMAQQYFGGSVSLSFDTAIIGAVGDQSKGYRTGAAYVFVRSGTTWSIQQKLIGSDTVQNDDFGSSVSIDGDTALIGASFDDSKGSAYIFVRTGTTWKQQQKLTSGVNTGSSFGAAVALSGQTALIGARVTDLGDGNFGAAYMFVRSGTTWSVQQKLTGGSGKTKFGDSVALVNNTALIAASGEGTGTAYVFIRSGTTWSVQQKLTASDGNSNDNFGAESSIALFGENKALIGARYDDVIGSAYLFTRSGASWTFQKKFTASDGNLNDNFGSSVALSNTIALIGARYAANNGQYDEGVGYFFNITP